MSSRKAVPIILVAVLSACVLIPPAPAQPRDDRPAADAADRPTERDRPETTAGQPPHRPLELPRREARRPREDDPPPHRPGQREHPGRVEPGQPTPPRWDRRPPMAENEMARLGRHIELIERMRHTSFDPAMAGLVALGALRTDVPRQKPEDVVKDLEDLLRQVKSLGLRNSIRMMLKDLYRHLGNDAKVVEHLKAVVLENDAAIQKEAERRPPAEKAGKAGS